MNVRTGAGVADGAQNAAPVGVRAEHRSLQETRADEQEMVNIVDIAIGCGDHFAENLCDGHGMPPLSVS